MKLLLIFGLAMIALIPSGQADYLILTPTPIQTPFCRHTGDINFDGLLSFGDSQITFRCALGLYSPTFEEFCAGDCNGDEAITSGDA